MNNVGYIGRVNLQMLIDGKKYAVHVHNNGLPALFKGLCMSLCGVDNSEYIPTCIDVVRSVSGEFSPSDFESIVRNQEYPQFTTPTYFFMNDGGLTAEGTWVAQFQTVIHSEILTEDVSSSLDYHRLYIRGAAGYLAYVDIDIEELQVISDSSSLEVTWIMGFVDMDSYVGQNYNPGVIVDEPDGPLLPA